MTVCQILTDKHLSPGWVSMCSKIKIYIQAWMYFFYYSNEDLVVLFKGRCSGFIFVILYTILG